MHDEIKIAYVIDIYTGPDLDSLVDPRKIIFENLHLMSLSEKSDVSTSVFKIILAVLN